MGRPATSGPGRGPEVASTSASSPFATAGTVTVFEPPPSSGLDSPRASADEPTHYAAQAFGEETEIVRNAPPAPDEEDSQNVFETFEHDRRTPVPSGPTVVPTRVQPAQSGASGARPLPLPHVPDPMAPAPGAQPNPLLPSPGAFGSPSSGYGNASGSSAYGNTSGSQPSAYAGTPGSQPNPMSGAYAGAPGSQPNLVPGSYGMAPGSQPNVLPQGPGAYLGAPLAGSSANRALPVPLSGMQPMQGRPRLDGSHGRTTPLPPELVRRRRQKRLIAIGSLGGLMVLSFVIALAASSGGRPAARAIARQDAGVASRDDAAVLPIAPPPVDAALTPTVPTVPTVPDDAAPDEASGDAYLEVRTIPDGGTVTVGDQVRVATADPANLAGGTTARLVLQAGDFDVVAEVAGYQPEKRRVHLMRGEHQKIEIAFTRKLDKRPDRGPPMGRLSVRTTPWSDVYSGTKKLGQAPFADLELAAGTYTLTFKNPSRPVVTKTVKIAAGKSQKLNFNLP